MSSSALISFVLFSACALPSSIEHGSTTATGNTITSGQTIVLTCDAASETRDITCTDGTWDPELTCPGELQGPGESVLFIVFVNANSIPLMLYSSLQLRCFAASRKMPWLPAIEAKPINHYYH